MKIKALITSISASFDQFVSQVENHEAVAESMLTQVRQGAAQIRLQYSQVSARLKHMENHIEDLEQKSRNWKQRALSLKESDQAKALRCVHAMQQCEQKKEALEQQVNELLSLRSEMESQLSSVEQHLEKLMNKKQSLRARQAKNKSAATLHQLQPVEDSSGVFERWEQTVLEQEYAHSYEGVCDEAYSSADAQLEQEFNEQEKHEKLKDTLAQLSLEKSPAQ